MILDVKTAAIASLLFVLLVSIAAGTAAGAWGIAQMPTINPMVVALMISGAGLIASLIVIYKTYA